MAQPTTFGAPTAPPAGGAGAGARPAPDPVAEMQKQMAMAAAQQGARQAGTVAKGGLIELTSYIQENPTSMKVICFLTGLVLMVLSLTGVFGVTGLTAPRSYLGNLYNAIFGFIICVADMKEDWSTRYFCNVQEKLHHYMFLLATQSGKAIFYFYVGSVTLLVLPDGFWKVIYICLGGVLCLEAIVMLIINWCGKWLGCDRSYGEMSEDRRGGGTSPHVGASI